MSPRVFTSALRQSDRDQLFDALVHMHPLVAVNTLDLGEYLLLQVGRRKATPGGDETGVLDSSDISNQPRA